MFTPHPDWLVPQWPAPARVRALCTTRAGGRSAAPFDSFNLGDHVGDDPRAVSANRDLLGQVMGARPLFLSQSHGNHVVCLSGETAPGAPADGCVTALPQQACTIMVADCLPVLFCNAQGSLVGAAHAGWRGLAGVAGHGILEEVVARFKSRVGADGGPGSSEIMAWLGPCIGADAFEVGSEVREVFVAHDGAAQTMFRPRADNKWLADLQGLARQRLKALGVTQIYGNDGNPAWCTVSQPSRFFSYRRDRVSGRMAACIWLD